MAGVIVWIDAATAAGDPGLFGIAPIDRHLRALARLRPRPSRIVLSGPADGTAVPAGLPVERRVDHGPAGARLARFLAETDAGTVVALDGRAVVDPRLVAFLARSGPSVVALDGEAEERAAALRLDPRRDTVPGDAPTLAALGEDLVAAGRLPSLRQEDFPSFVANLRRTVPFFLFAPRDAVARRRRERWMFWSNYKGSTDVLTKWVYPPLVWPLVRLATRHRIHPNTITLVSAVLTFACVPLFAAGWFWSGLALAFAMTVLDSVDGKVARVTLTDSAIGNVLDHGLDIVHPPLWYGAWAWGLGARTLDDPLALAAIWLIAFYVGDRLVLMVAKARFKRGLHAVAPIDAAIRTWIARRNVNLAIFTGGLALGHGETAFHAIAAWQGLTMLWHAARTGWLLLHPPRFDSGRPA